MDSCHEEQKLITGCPDDPLAVIDTPPDPDTARDQISTDH